MKEDEITISKVLKTFNRYQKDYEIESKPENYIHKGLKSGCQFSDLISDIKKAVEDCLEASLLEEIKMNNEGNQIHFLISKGHNMAKKVQQQKIIKIKL